MWAAQFDFIPISLQRSNLDGLPGGIVSLCAKGELHVSFLGSEPFDFKVPPMSIEKFNFERTHKELIELEEEIRQSIDWDDIDTINRRASENLRIKLVVSAAAQISNEPILDEAIKSVPARCNGNLRFKTKIPLDEIQIAFNKTEDIKCSFDPMTYIAVPADKVEDIKLQIDLEKSLSVESAKIEAVVSFISKDGIPRVLYSFAYLPLDMFFKTVQPQKNSSVKVTFTIASKSISSKISTFFPEFSNRSLDSEAQALGLRLLHPSSKDSDGTVTVIAAKNSNRIRYVGNT